ncbi:hypothetical protein S40285_01295 [Stachybotrys chlorohalonatus IBT 40285]|uniref:Extracellular membrane protein CFEM domain-containing protein n=1 Tax=Stachybotrys chlorohalonatus (strain IBT 40285) TaxID=1283841 RepID=A0A084QR21_STAC4|nr:hypothetical protein S40285_01295 [Stachybotrys chlorohalonata IBT 40285]
MKFFFPLALLAIAGVSAQDTECEADYIVTRCLETEQAKVEECDTLDYDCLCAAHEAVATCYNNCPNDSRAHDANNLVTIHCQNASLYGTRTATRTATSSATAATDAAATTTDDADETEDDADETSQSTSGTATSSAEGADNTGAAADLARNTGGVLLAVAGAVAALL